MFSILLIFNWFLCISNTILFRSFVRRSACWFSDALCCRRNSFSLNLSRMKWYDSVLIVYVNVFISSMKFWVFNKFDCAQVIHVKNRCTILEHSWIRLFIHMIFFIVWLAAMYSVSVIDRATVCCRIDPQAIAE